MTSTGGSVSFVLLIVVVANGCASQSVDELRRPVTRSEPSGGLRSEPRTSSRSDRLRDDPNPWRLPERSSPIADTPTQEQTPPPRGTDEPDPQAVIDWLLRRSR
jgi:hypothetical protein